MIGLLPTALAGPAPLLPPRCPSGVTASWVVSRDVSGRSHGEHITSGEVVDRPIQIHQQQRVRLRCLSSEPARAELTVAYPDGAGGWAERPERITLAMPAAGTFTVEQVDANGADPDQAALWARRDALRDPLAWIFPPIAGGAAWEGAWPIEAGPWWGCHVSVTAGADGTHAAEGRCDDISYSGQNRLTGTFVRADDGFGVQSARWGFSSVWEHYMVYTDTMTIVTVQRLPEE